ncbi:MAG: type II secretion system F family protein [Tyzzerella sp.]|nr:type II secretion system F family protein [Tyzzerella sp.]
MKKKIIMILTLSMILSVTLFLMENVFKASDKVVKRNAYGEGEKVTEYEVSVDGEEGTIEIEVEEQEYSEKDVQKMFREVMERLDEVILGENESFNRVEKNLNLVTTVDNYPVRIEWQLDSYSVMNLYGEIQEDNVVPGGTLVELRGIISYRDKEAIYVQSARVYPLTRSGMDKLLYELKNEARRIEESTRQEDSFVLPEKIGGRDITWTQKKENRWHYVLFLGIAICVYLVYREQERAKRETRKRAESLLRDYPGMISKFTMLLSTGTTLRSAWEKIVQNYEQAKESMGTHPVYEEMLSTLHEIQGGVSEAEAYEHFGKRCGSSTYMKFGTLLSQNLRKGSKGISDLLRMEAIQSFENRKNTAKRLGEEAGTKLLIPMLGMLAVVFIMVMVPAFLSMQL